MIYKLIFIALLIMCKISVKAQNAHFYRSFEHPNKQKALRVCYTPTLVAVTYKEPHEVLIWDTRPIEPTVYRRWKVPNNKRIINLQMSPNRNYVAMIDFDFNVWVWDLAQDSVIRHYKLLFNRNAEFNNYISKLKPGEDPYNYNINTLFVTFKDDNNLLMGGLQRIMEANIQTDTDAKTVFTANFPHRVNAAFIDKKRNELCVYTSERINLLHLDPDTYIVKAKEQVISAVPLTYMVQGSADEIVFLNSFESYNFTNVYVYNQAQSRMTAHLRTNNKEHWSIANTRNQLLLQATSDNANFANMYSTKSKNAFIKAPLRRIIEDSSFVANDTTILTCSWGGTNNSRVDIWYWGDLQALIPKNVAMQDRFTTHCAFPDVEVKNKTVTMSVWDNAQIDGDRVTIMLNNEIVLENYELTATPKNISLTLLPQQPNRLTIHANSIGTLPPNTVSVRVIDGKKTETMVLKADLNSSEFFFLMANFK